jgi:uncharacterized RmlC-like cupin family protein
VRSPSGEASHASAWLIRSWGLMVTGLDSIGVAGWRRGRTLTVMGDQSGVRVFQRAEWSEAPGPVTPGMHRLEALAEDGAWLGTVTTEPNTISGWHHHGDYETYIYVLSGAARLDTIDAGTVERHEAPAGSFIVVPRGTVHREGSASPTGVEAVLVRIGSGQVVFPVEGLPERD